MRRLSILLLVVVSLLFARNLLALSGNAILKKVEDTMNAPRDRIVTERMVLIKAGGSEKERTIRFYQKGNRKRMVVFLSPADVKGVSFLSLSRERMYLYLPAFRKVRRIASHIKGEDFMGTDFSYEDMAETEYTKDYTATLIKEDDSQYVLELKPRSKADVSYSKKIIWVDKKTFVSTRGEYYSRTGELIKVIRAENIRQVDGYWFPMKMTMRTVIKNHQTILEVMEIKHDVGLADNFFSERNLKRQAR